MKLSQLSAKQLKKYENHYIAVTIPDKEIIADGTDAKTAMRAAKANGYPDAFVLRIFPLDSFYVGYGV